jgi:chromosome segregation ATPase
MSDGRDIERRQKMIDDYDITHRHEIKKFKSHAEELETELSKAKDLAADYDSSRQDAITCVNSLVEALQSNLDDVDKTKAGLKKEKDTAGCLDALVQDLKGQLAKSE